MQLWHVTWSSEGRLPLFPDEALRRRAVRKLAEVAGGALVVFCLVDEHVHVALVGDETVSRRRVRAITRSLRVLSAVPLDAARIRPIEGRNHMETVLDYCLRQPAKHGLPCHPALWSGGCLPDLVGARLVPRLTLGVQVALPRFEPRNAFASVGLPGRPLTLPGPAELRALGLGDLLAAATAALCVDPLPRTDWPGDVLARRAFVHLAREGSHPTASIAAVLGCGDRGVRGLAHGALPETARRAVLARLALEARVRAVPSGVRPPA